MEFSNQNVTFEKYGSTRQISADINNLSLRLSIGLVFHLVRNGIQLTSISYPLYNFIVVR